jgi:hypothetical protein
MYLLFIQANPSHFMAQVIGRDRSNRGQVRFTTISATSAVIR